MKHLHEILKHLFQSKTFITFGGLSSFTVGAFLFGGGVHIEFIEFFIKLFATVLSGFFGGCAGQLGKHFGDNIKNKCNVKKKRGENSRDKAA